MIVYLYSEETPTPRQFDAMKEHLFQYDPEAQMRDASLAHEKGELKAGDKILVLGSKGPSFATIPGYELQYTISPKQLESRANAGTIMEAAFKNYYGQVDGLPAHDVRIYNTAQFTSDYLARVFDLDKPIAIDVETGGTLGLNVTSRTAPMLTIAFAQGGNAVTLMLKSLDKEDSIKWLQSFLPNVKKPIFHNGKFDIQVIESNVGVRMPNWFDTMLAHHVLNMAAREHGLKILCKRYFNAEDWEKGLSDYVKGKTPDYANVPWETLAIYNAYDVLWTYRLWQYLEPLIEADEDAQRALFLEMRAADFLSDVEAVGIPVSSSQVATLAFNYGVTAGENLDVLRGITQNYAFNPGSPQQVKRWLEQALGREVKSTNEENIDLIKEEVDEGSLVDQFCIALIGYRKAKKMMSTYLGGWSAAAAIENDSRAHPTFNVHGTTTGRLSSSEPNAQNVPRDKTIRKMVTLDERNELF